MAAMADARVLVVGAGPTGLVLAAQLLARGIPVRIVDRAAVPLPWSRALAVHARSLEMLERMGLAEAFVARGHRVHRFHAYADQRTLLNLDMRRNGSKYRFILHIPQTETERLLRAHVHELGGVLERGIELVGLRQDAGAVHVRLRDDTGRETAASYSYVVGCDGAHSRVRDEAGIAFDGRDYPQDWLLADVRLEGAGPEDEVHGFFRSTGLPVVCLPLGQGRWRVVTSDLNDRGGVAPSFEEMQELVAERAPRRITFSDPQWLSCFRCQLRTSAAYRRGRVFVAGDAAHVHSPAGGQGMNTGMQDAENLAWKLALVLGDRAPDSLLDTYEQERRPIAANVLGLTDKIVSWTTLRHPVKRAVRDALVPAATRLPAIQRRAAQRLSQISVSYPGSSLIRPDGRRRRSEPGARFPDVELDRGTSLYQVLGGGRHALLIAGPEARAALATAGIGGYCDLVEMIDVQRASGHKRKDAFALVRPDGVLAARGSRDDTDRVLDYLNRLGARATSRLPTDAGHKVVR